MKTKLLLTLASIGGSLCYSQIMPPAEIKVYFQYDEAGNQVFRGDGMLSRAAKNDTIQKSQIVQTTKSELLDEKAFWNLVRIYPVPVKNTLTIDWSDEVNQLIGDVGLYQQSTIHWVFQNNNIPALNKQIKIDMSSQYMGVYILTFTLKDGRIFSKNITKH